MKKTSFFTICFHFLIFYSIFVCDVLASEKLEIIAKKCSTEYRASIPIPNFNFNCSVVMATEEVLQSSHLGCNRFNYRSLIVRAFAEIKHDVKFICVSNNAITIDITFADGIVQKDYLNMKWSRNVFDLKNPLTYTYSLQIFPPTLPINADTGDAVKFTFCSMQYPSESIDVLWFSHYTTDSFSDNLVYWMDDKRELEELRWTSNFQSVSIPCVSPYDVQLRKYGINNSNAIRFNSTKFEVFLHTTENKKEVVGKYGCFNPGFNSSSLNFSIAMRPLSSSASYTVYRNYSDVFQTTVFFTSAIRLIRNHTITAVDGRGLSLILKCGSPNQTVTFRANKARRTNNNGSWECSDRRIETFDPLYNQTIKSVECFVSDGLMVESLDYGCFHEGAFSNDTPIHIWLIMGKDNSKLGYDVEYIPKKHQMKCTFPLLNGSEVYFKQESCQNPLTCKFNEKFLRMSKIVNPTASCYIDNNRRLRKCGVIKPANKGVLICDANQNFEHSNVYFMGFNKIFYQGINVKPEKEAVIKLKTIGKSDQIMVNNNPVKFTLHCEAHSFYFEHGIQWLFEYRNGTQELIPSDLISDNINHSPNEYEEDYANPSSFVNILIPDIDIKKIVCAAPRLSILKLINFREWIFQTTNISVLASVPPKIVDVQNKFSFSNGDLNREIKCQATGLPQPEIYWSTKSGQNISEDFITDLSIYSILKFPIYNKSYEGDYECTASSAVGNVSKVFSVRTSSLLDLKMALVIGFFVVFIITFVAAFFFYTRKLKLKQSLEMENIIKLLNGCSNDAELAAPLQVPYDNSWELEKHSFCIDHNKILGCGEYGIVFKGTVAKLNIDVAFKSLKSPGNMTHLKALVSEIKLVTYIGKHSNIVEFIGAYTQEIQRGIIYIANEFCALGSLESYLRCNKGRFQKCPVLSSYFELSNTLQECNKENSETSNHTIKSLLKWCSEISNALDFLFSRKVVHGDLATRNVLLTVDWATKVTDFGLSRRTYNSDQYVKKGQDPLPWRWLALESLQTNVFDVKTDVWAFGITLWEIFSLGEIPYPGISPSMEFVKQIEMGLRNPKPKYASQKLYDVMVECWHLSPEERPSFASLTFLFQNALANDEFNVDVKDLALFEPLEEEIIEYYELEELKSNDVTID